MRRRRQTLQVSTFPFLAVLLCAMGSLILLLLVIDRQAKVVARKKAQLAAAESREQIEQEWAKRQAEWERRRQALRERLEGERRELLAECGAVAQQTAAANGELQDELARAARLRQKLRDEEARLLQARAQVESRRAEAARGAGATARAKDELNRLAGELEQLDAALKALIEKRRREMQTYSLVPYGGRRGGNRRPLYVECTASGAVFHPGRVALEGPDFTPAKLRAEVTGRVARQQPPSATPYLLMLVRPDGITNYYATMNALAELRADFGYEFIEADWHLDFSDADGETTPEWAVAQGRPSGGGGNLGPGGGGMKWPPSAGAGGGGDGLSPTPSRAGIPGGAGPSGSGHADRRDGKGPGAATPGNGPGSGQSAQGPAGPWHPKGTNAVGKGNKDSHSGAATEPSLMPPAPAWLRPGQAGGTPGNGGDAQRGASEDKERKGAAGGKRPEDEKGQRAEGQPEESGPRVPLPLGGGGDSGGGRPALGAAGGGPRPAPPPLSRLTGNRDWLIVIECRADGVHVPALRRTFPVGEAVRGQEHELARAVREMIARRQGTLRQGEPPYRPLLRFRVHPDGLRAYYFAYPLLESLRVPMSRENAD